MPINTLGLRQTEKAYGKKYRLNRVMRRGAGLSGRQKGHKPMPDLRMPQHSKLTVTGRTTRQGSLKQGPKADYCDVSIAVDRGFGEDKTAWFLNCRAFGKTAERLAKVPKGAPVLLDGDFEMRTWEGRDGLRTDPHLDIRSLDELAWAEKGEDEPVPEEDIPF